GRYGRQVAGEVKPWDHRGFQDGMVGVHAHINDGHDPHTGSEDPLRVGHADQDGGPLVDVTAQDRGPEEGDHRRVSQRVEDGSRGLVELESRGSFWNHHIRIDRKSTRLNSSHGSISYAVFCLKKKT